MRTYKIYGTGAAAADNVTNLLVAKSGRIKSIRWDVAIDQVADNSRCTLELSLRSNSQAVTSDTTGDISVIQAFGNLTTSGTIAGRAAKQELVDIPIAASERIYLHAALITTSTYYATVYIDVAEGA